MTNNKGNKHVNPVNEVAGVRDRQNCSLLVRGRVIADMSNPDKIINEGAVCIVDDRIVAVDTYKQLQGKYQPDKIVGSNHHVVVPGFINAHDHLRTPSTIQSGISDDALELWILDLLRLPYIDPVLSSTMACAQLIESGVTTVLNSFYESGAEQYIKRLEQTILGCEQAGIRTVQALSILDQSIVATLLERVKPALSEDRQALVNDFMDQRSQMTVSDYFDILRDCHNRLRTGRHTMMTGPVSVHWCSEELLQEIWSEASALDISIQTHLLESPFQYREAMARYGKSAVEHMSEAGLLSPKLSCAHCVQLTEKDMDLLADSGTSVIHNAGSNLRLSNGIAPVVAMQRNGINIGLGLDGMSINDDGDMLQEMRLVSCLHRSSQRNETTLTARHVLKMGTINGARALGMQHEIGTLALGKKADLIILGTDDMEIPGSSGDVEIMDMIINRAKKTAIETVVIDGELVFHQGVHLKIDKDGLLKELKTQLTRMGTPPSNINELLVSVKPYVHRIINDQ